MRKIKIRLPATLTHFAPSLDTLGLAISLYTQVDFTLRNDKKVVITTDRSKKKKNKKAEHPVAIGISHFFSHIDKPSIGVDISINNEIPIACGLGEDTAFTVAGVLAANIFADNPFTRQELIPIASTPAPHSDGAIASLMGGLASSLVVDDIIHYRTLPITPFRMLIAVPNIAKFKIDDLPKSVSYQDMQHNIKHTVMLQHALATGDMNLLAHSLNDPINQPLIRAGNPLFSDIHDYALDSGAIAVTTTGQGYAIIFFVEEKHLSELQTNLTIYFDDYDQPTDVLPVSVDTQGVIISVMQST